MEDFIYLNLVQDFFHKNPGFDPFEKYARQTGNLPNVRGENLKKIETTK